MPIYEYHCQQCGHEFESTMSVRQREKGPKPRCPKCKSRKVAKLPSQLLAVTAKKS